MEWFLEYCMLSIIKINFIIIKFIISIKKIYYFLFYDLKKFYMLNEDF